MGAVDALHVVDAAFPSVLGSPAPSLLGLQEGQRVLSYAKDNTSAVLADSDGHQSLVDSILPLRTDDGSGTPTPVDLGLTDTANGFAPRNPLIPMRIPDHLSDGISRGTGGLRIYVDGESGPH